MSRIRTVTNSTNVLGEGPHWVEKDKALIYVDILSSSIHRYFPGTNSHQTLIVEGPNKERFTTPFIIPLETIDDRYVIGYGSNIGFIDWPISDHAHSKKEPKLLCSVEEGQDTQLNDAKCDPQGRLWAGTMCEIGELCNMKKETGAFYSFDSQGNSKKWLDKISVSNGIAFSNDHDHMYYIDSLAHNVVAFQYDDSTGRISGHHDVYNFKKAGLGDGIPDGMTTDVNDNLWIAYYGGQTIVCIDPVAGKIVRKLNMPCKHITSICWGGPDYSTLYATSGIKHLPTEEVQLVPEAGKLFEVTGLGTKGWPAFGYKFAN